MVIKYSKSGIAYALPCLFFLLALGGCGGLPTKTSVDRQSATSPVAQPGSGSAQYLPLVKQDRKGRTLPYTPQPNPYLSLQRNITPGSLADYAAAEKAFKRKDYKLAEAKLNSITQRESGLSGPWVMLGDIALAKSDSGKAESLYRKALEVNRLNVNAYLRLARVQRMLGRFDQAQTTYINALAVWRDFPEAHLNLGILYDLYLNEPVQAQRHVEAYQFLRGGSDERVAQWLEEIRMRSGANPRLTVGN